MNPSPSRKTSQLYQEIIPKSAVVGGASGFCTRLLVHPFDVIKIRFQLQWEGVGRYHTVSSRYKSIAQAFLDIAKTEGTKAFWKGHVSAQILSIAFSSTQFYVYGKVISHIQNFYPDLPDVPIRFISGGIAGLAATLVSHPMDTLRTRFVAQGKTVHYNGLNSAVRQMYKEFGIRCFYRGLTPTFLEIVPVTGIHFMVFYTGKDYFQQKNIGQSSPATVAYCNVLLGLGAGLVAKALTHPLDVFKKRMQIQGFQHSRIGYGKSYTYRNFRECVHKMIAEETITGLYKGLLPNLIKASLSCALHFSLFEFGIYLVT